MNLEQGARIFNRVQELAMASKDLKQRASAFNDLHQEANTCVQELTIASKYLQR